MTRTIPHHEVIGRRRAKIRREPTFIARTRHAGGCPDVEHLDRR
jgi:hypothetical protein